MMITALTLFGLIGLRLPASDAELQTAAERAFAHGVDSRSDGVVARAYFARAASAYDDLWQRGHHNPALALNRARSRRLAGDLPGAIAVLHEGLAAAHYSRPLQVELEDARAAVAYPFDGELADQCRPRSASTIGTRMSPAEGYLAVGLLWLAVCLAVARFAMTRAARWVVLAGAGLAGLGVLGALWLQDARHRERDAARPIVIVREPTFLRKGNAESWDPRLEPRLPAGVEARELTRRGGWVQVELASGAVGWLPEPAVIGISNP